MQLEKKINIPTLLCVACRGRPATGIYTDGWVHVPLCPDCSSTDASAIFAAIMETKTHDVPPLKLHKHVDCGLPSQPRPRRKSGK